MFAVDIFVNTTNICLTIRVCLLLGCALRNLFIKTCNVSFHNILQKFISNNNVYLFSETLRIFWILRVNIEIACAVKM